MYQISSIQDDKQHILNALEEAQNRVDIVIITGGLGPTKDDITKKTIAEFFKDDKFVEYPEVIEHIKGLFQKINHPFKDIQRYQAQLPSKATLLKNRFGTAPGMWFFEKNTVFVSLPGVPYEMKGLITHEVLPRIQKQFQLPFILHKTIMTYGQGESVIAERIEHFEDNLPSFIKLAYLPSLGRVRLRLSAKGNNKEVLKKNLAEKIDDLYALLPDIITGIDEEGSIEKTLGILLKQKEKTVCTAESLTGGKIAASIVSVAGASSYFKGSFVTYTEEAKTDILSVSKQTIDTYSVVSEEVAKEMAINAKTKLNTDYAIAVTGNAGPTTDKTDKTVGVVFIAIATNTEVLVEEFNFGKPRERVIEKTVNKALELLQKEMIKNK